MMKVNIPQSFTSFSGIYAFLVHKHLHLFVQKKIHVVLHPQQHKETFVINQSRAAEVSAMFCCPQQSQPTAPCPERVVGVQHSTSFINEVQSIHYQITYRHSILFGCCVPSS
jgi:hypothetical protein